VIYLMLKESLFLMRSFFERSFFKKRNMCSRNKNQKKDCGQKKIKDRI